MLLKQVIGFVLLKYILLTKINNFIY